MYVLSYLPCIYILISALVGSLTVGTTFLMSPIAGVLIDRIGIRLTTFIGGFIATTSLLISSYFTNQVSANRYFVLTVDFLIIFIDFFRLI